MRTSCRIALSIVACGILLEGTNYNNEWGNNNSGNLSGGDKVTIDYDAKPAPPPQPPQPAPPFKQATNLTNKDLTTTGGGNITIEVKGNNATNPSVGSYTDGQNHHFGSAGSTIDLTINTPNADAFSITGGTLDFNASNTKMQMQGQGNGKALIRAQSATINLGGANKQVTAKGDIAVGGASKTNIELGNGSSFKGDIFGRDGTNNELKLKINGGSFDGTIKHNGITNVETSVDGRFNGNIEATGQSASVSASDNAVIQGGGINLKSQDNKVEAKGSSQIKSNITAENKLDLSTEGGKITGNITSSTKTTIHTKGNGGGITGNISSTSGNLTIDSEGSSQIQGAISSNGTTKITAKGQSHINGNITAKGQKVEIQSEGDAQLQGEINLETATNTINAKGNSSITGNIKTKNTSKIDLEGSAKISGNISSTSGDLTINSKDTSKITGNISHNGGNTTIIAKGSSEIAGNITAKGQKADITLEGGKITGGGTVDLQTNANTITASGNAQIQANITTKNKTTLDFKGQTQMTGNLTSEGQMKAELANNSKITGNITSKDTTTITSKDNAEISGSITTTGTKSTIELKNSSKISGNGRVDLGANTNDFSAQDNAQIDSTISANEGTTKITLKNNAKIIQGGIEIKKGTAKVDVKDNAEINGKIVQSGGDSTLTFETNSKMNGNITQTDGKSTIDFKNASKMTGNIEVTGGKTGITFQDTAQITGDVKAKGTENTVSFKEGTKLIGNLEYANKSTIDVTKSEITGNVEGAGEATVTLSKANIGGHYHQDGGKLDLTMTDSNIKQGFFGKNNAENKIKATKGSIEGGVKQNTGKLDLESESLMIKGGFTGTDSTNTIKATKGSIEDGITQSGGKLDLIGEELKITGGFQGSNQSQNTITLTKGSLEGGIKQDSGKLTWHSTDTDLKGGFEGSNGAENKVTIIGGNFNQGDIKQTGGSLKADILNLTNLGNFEGHNSTNIIHLSNTEIKNISQEGGSLEFRTNSKVDGNIAGSNGSQNKIEVSGADITGSVSQNSGKMDLHLTNGNITSAGDSISASNRAEFGLYATNSKISGNIKLDDAQSKGVSENLTLQGTFIQSRGDSTMTFTKSHFTNADSIKLSQTRSASLIFAKSEIKNISATNGASSIVLTNSKMGDFTGQDGLHSLTLTESQGGDFSQNNGTLSIGASAQSTITSVTGTTSTLTLNLSAQSKVTGNVKNSGTTVISMQDSEIGGNVEQTNGSMNLNANNSIIQGKYTQTNGSMLANLSNSKIEQGVELTDIQVGSNLALSDQSQINAGLKSTNSDFSYALSNSSKINGGVTQSGGKVIGNLTQSEIDGGMTLENGTTNVSLHNKSKLMGDITATNNTTTILVEDSQMNGNITVTGKSLDLTARVDSVIRAPQMKVTNADLKLTLDTRSKFIGDLAQTNNKQDIVIKQNSEFQGSITNTNTTGTIKISDTSTLTKDLKQTQGSLSLDLSNAGKIGGNVTLENADTTLSGNGAGNQIGGNFSQSNGTLRGEMNGLTLKGTYSQTGGTSSVKFNQSTFEKDTSITNATSSSLTFDRSTLKNYMISGGNDNTLKLLNTSKMTGDLTLKNNSQSTLVMRDSEIDGNIKGSGNSILTLDTKNATITKNIEFDTGALKGLADNTKIGGSVSLKNTTSNVSFVNTSEIKGDLKAEGAQSDNTIQFNASSVKGNVSANQGKINLDLSNGSSIGRNVEFKNMTKAHLTGKAAGNEIKGNLTSTDSNLTGDIGGLTLHGTFTQTNGTSDIVFRDNSLFKGEVTINNATNSKLSFVNNSGIANKISITGGNDNTINLENASFIKGDTTLQDANTTINAKAGSSITGNLTANAQQGKSTNLNLDNSSLTGNITQTEGDLKVDASNGSTIKGNLTATNAKTDLKLSNSTLTGSITQSGEHLKIDLSNKAILNANTANKLEITNANLSILSNDSTLNVDLQHIARNPNPNPNPSAEIMLQNDSTYNGRMEFQGIKSEIKVNHSALNSAFVKVSEGEFKLSYNDSANGGLITKMTIDNAPTTISADNSRASIEELMINNAPNRPNNSFNLTASNHARLTSNITLDGQTKAIYRATSNGNLNVNTKIKNQASTLSVTLDGGLLQGDITQDPKGAAGFATGELALSQAGGFGGRWAVTNDSQVHSLVINNDPQSLQGRSLFASAFDNPISMVDFTLEFADDGLTSRVGKEMLVRPAPDPVTGLIPPPGANQTYARTLKVDNLSGNHGLFRVYADLGTDLADKIVATQASGEHLIQVQYRADTFQDIGKKRIVVAKVTDPNTQVAFQGTQSEVGLTRYDTEIIKEAAQGGGYEWIIGQATPSGISYTSKIIASILQSQYRSFAVEVDSLDRRLGDLRGINRDKGFWARSYIGRASQDALPYAIGVIDQYYSVWTGFDYNAIDLTGNNFIGVFFNYTGMNSESKDYTGETSNFALGFYDTFKFYSGFYFDVLAKYIYTTSHFKIINYSLLNNKPKIDNHKFLANLEVGYTFYLGERFKSSYIQPQFQITSGYVQKVDLDFVDVSGERIQTEVGHNAPVMMRLGAFWGKAFGEKIRANLKLGSSLAYDVNGGGELNFKDSNTSFKSKQKGDFRWILSAHADVRFNDIFRLYTSLDSSFFGHYNTIFNFNIGLRVSFGARNNVIAQVPQVYNPIYSPPVPDNDTRTVPVVQNYTTQDINHNYQGRSREVPKERANRPRIYLPQSAPTSLSRQNYRDSGISNLQINRGRP